MPSELRHQILSYLDAPDLKNAKCVSSKWLQICTYPTLWKSLYFQDDYSIAPGPMLEFERRIAIMQERIDEMFANSLDADLPYLYNAFCHALNVGSIPNGTSPYRHRQQLRSLFSKIASIQLGQEFYRSASFLSESDGSIQVVVDWHYIYLHRSLLEKNWRSGSCVPILIDGAPDRYPGSREVIYCVVFDHNTLAAGSRDCLIRVWDMPSLNYRGGLCAHEGSVLCLQLDSKRDLLISGSSDATIKVWDLRTGAVIQQMWHMDSVLGLHFDGLNLVSCSKDTTARIWRWSDGSDVSSIDESAELDDEVPYPKFVSVRVLTGHRAPVNCVHFMDGIVATASADRTVRIWNFDTGAIIRTVQSHNRGISSVQLTPNYIITGSSDHVMKIIDRTTGSEVRALVCHTGLVRSIDTHHSLLVSGGYDQTIKVCDVKSGELLHQLPDYHSSK